MRINPINNTAAMPHLSTKRNIQPRYGNISEPVNEPVQQDAVNFKGLLKKKVNIDLHNAIFYAEKLASSTPERKAVYTGGSMLKDEVKLISLGIASYVLAQAANDPYNIRNRKPRVVIGRDVSEPAKESLNVAKEILRKQGVDVLEIKDPVPAPMLTLSAMQNYADLAVFMTTSRDYNKNSEYTIITKHGVVAPEEVTKEIAGNIEKIAEKGSYKQKLFNRGEVTKANPYNTYRMGLMVDSCINWKNIKNSGLHVYYNGMYGAGDSVVPKLFKSFGIQVELVSPELNTSESESKNMLAMGNIIANDDKNPLRIGFVSDQNAENISVIDEKGNIMSPDDVLLLAAYHLAENKGQKGTIIHSQAVSSQLGKLADKYSLNEIETPVGFKYINENILKLRQFFSDILIAGDKSGGMAVKNHIPAKDGIMAISLIMDLVAKEGKPVSEILKDVKQSLGKYYETSYFSKNIGLSNNIQESINKIMAKAEGLYKSAVDLCEDDLGDDIHTIDNNKTEAARLNIAKYKKDGDGVKLIMTDGSSIFLRPDEKELAINCYIDAAGKTSAEAKENAENLRMFMEDFLAE